jgi:hypothetical protein
MAFDARFWGAKASSESDEYPSDESDTGRKERSGTLTSSAGVSIDRWTGWASTALPVSDGAEVRGSRSPLGLAAVEAAGTRGRSAGREGLVA